MPFPSGRSRGFTLVELVAVVLVIGVLASFVVPVYLRSLEEGKADDATLTLRMVGQANRLYRLERGYYVEPGEITNSAACSSRESGSRPTTDLVGCKYLQPQDWASKPYTFYAGNVCGGSAKGTIVACARRKQGSGPGTTAAPYKDWVYAVDDNESIVLPTGAGVRNPSRKKK